MLYSNIDILDRPPLPRFLRSRNDVSFGIEIKRIVPTHTTKIRREATGIYTVALFRFDTTSTGAAITRDYTLKEKRRVSNIGIYL